MLQIRHLTIRHRKDNRIILEDLSITLHRGDRAALIGEEKILTAEEAIIGAQSMDYSFERAFGYVYPHPAIAVRHISRTKNNDTLFFISETNLLFLDV